MDNLIEKSVEEIWFAVEQQTGDTVYRGFGNGPQSEVGAHPIRLGLHREAVQIRILRRP